MTLEEAITQLGSLAEGDSSLTADDDVTAVELGIEALKEILRHRRPTNLAIIGLLPGETEEQERRDDEYTIKEGNRNNEARPQ